MVEIEEVEPGNDEVREEKIQEEGRLKDTGALWVLSLTRNVTLGNNLNSLCFTVLYKERRVILSFSYDGYEWLNMCKMLSV